MAPTADNAWTCNTCKVRFTKESDKLMECEYCSDHFCIQCLKMTSTTYNYHIKTPRFWFCNQQDSFTNMIADRSAWGLMCQFRLK